MATSSTVMNPDTEFETAALPRYPHIEHFTDECLTVVKPLTPAELHRHSFKLVANNEGPKGTEHSSFRKVKGRKRTDSGTEELLPRDRIYHHSLTTNRILPHEVDVDSEDERVPEWIETVVCQQLDEFTDVNDGEKEIMKMWNLHVLKHNYVGNCQVLLACQKFVEFCGLEVVEKKLYANFLLHLTGLCGLGLLSPAEMMSVVERLRALMPPPLPRRGAENILRRSSKRARRERESCEACQHPERS